MIAKLSVTVSVTGINTGGGVNANVTNEFEDLKCDHA